MTASKKELLTLCNSGPWEYNKNMSEPFAHEDLDLKQGLLKMARDLHEKGDSLENALAVGMIYMNVADYLAEYLVIGLSELTTEAVNKYYLGVVGVKSPKRETFNIGSSLRYLERFEFPKKSEIIGELKSIKSARDTLAHQIFKTKGQNLKKLDKAHNYLVKHTENLVNLVDDIRPGLPPQNLIDKYINDQKV